VCLNEKWCCVCVCVGGVVPKMRMSEREQDKTEKARGHERKYAGARGSEGARGCPSARAVCCSVLQCVVVCCSILQCAAVRDVGVIGEGLKRERAPKKKREARERAQIMEWQRQEGFPT